MFEFGGYGSGSPEIGAGAYGNAYTGFNDYYNQLYPDQASRAYGAQQAGGRTMFTDPPQNGTAQPGMPQQQQKMNKQKTTSFGQYESLDNFQPGGQGSMMPMMHGGGRGLQDIDYATFLRFMSQIGPMLFGAQR